MIMQEQLDIHFLSKDKIKQRLSYSSPLASAHLAIAVS